MRSLPTNPPPHPHPTSLSLLPSTSFIFNRDNHWFAIRLINGRFWNLNSLSSQPTVISHFALAAEVSAFVAAGYSVFCCLDSNGVDNAALPNHAREEWEMERGMPSFWWKEEELLKGR